MPLINVSQSLDEQLLLMSLICFQICSIQLPLHPPPLLLEAVKGEIEGK